VFGEIAFFAPHGRRTGDRALRRGLRGAELDQDAVRQIYFQNPSFGFELIGLVAGPPLAPTWPRLEQQLAQAQAGAAA
jgi:CRP-like cAMP-binding protein